MIKPMTDNESVGALLTAAHPFRGLGEAEDIAKAAVFLASDDASWVSGIPLPVDGMCPSDAVFRFASSDG